MKGKVSSANAAPHNTAPRLLPLWSLGECGSREPRHVWQLRYYCGAEGGVCGSGATTVELRRVWPYQ